jgi:hypothetical protein
MSQNVIPLTNLLPETAAALVLEFLGFTTEKRRTRCIACNSSSGRRCQKKTTGHLCSQHLEVYHQNINLHCWKSSLVTFSCLLHGVSPKHLGNDTVVTLRKFTEPQRCKRCHLTWKCCHCPCQCLDCNPCQHLHIPDLKQRRILDPYNIVPNRSRKTLAITCKRSGIYRNHMYNNPTCEYCIKSRPCHKIENVNPVSL